MVMTNAYFDNWLNILNIRKQNDPSNIKMKELETLLILATKLGHFEMVKFTIENGASHSVNNGSPVVIAMNHGHIEIMEYLIRQGASFINNKHFKPSNMSAMSTVLKKLNTTINGQLPEHKCGLFLTHNEHKNYYETAEQYIKECEEREQWDIENWASPEHRQRAINTDEIWELQWYAQTPIGKYSILAPTLEELLTFANS